MSTTLTKILVAILVALLLMPAHATYAHSRLEELPPDTVVGVDGLGGFYILSVEGRITTGPGTIVTRDGRRVSGRDIQIWDHVTVTLAGENRAAIVMINQTPNFSGVQIVRARIQSVDAGRNFRVHSLALFDGLNWHFTPIDRLFTIDHNTMFMIDGRIMNLNQFLSFTPEAGIDGALNVFDRVFNVVIDGSRAAWVTDAPYATHAVRGTIYHIAGNTIYLNNFHVRRPDRPDLGTWVPVSIANPVGSVSVGQNSIIVDRDQVIGIQDLQVGQQVRVMTTSVSIPDTPTAGMSVNGYIVLVER